jgi:alpha-D-xyloside xylohydrolase
MIYKTLVHATSLALLTTGANAYGLKNQDETCSLSDSDKKDCGYAGITSNECTTKGCCWSPAGENSVAPWCFYSAIPSTCSVNDSDRVDCGYSGITSDQCQSKGCCWSPAGENSQAPWCFYDGALEANQYSLSAMTPTATGFEGTLTLIGGGDAVYGQSIQTLKLQVLFEGEDYARIKITDPSTSRWEVPQSVVPRPTVTQQPSTLNYDFTYTENPFSFQITRKSDGVVVYKFSDALKFKDQYLELTSQFDPQAKTFGIGESTRTNHALTAGSTYTLWARDEPAAVFNVNLYGSLPYYVQMLNGKASGAMLMNSNGMDVKLDTDSVKFSVIGGIIDLYVFIGPTIEQVTQQYTSIVGKPTMMPYWSFGFHNCKYGYKTVYEVEEVVANYRSAGIPLDTQWMDIDYMEAYRDFTTDSINFPLVETQKFVTQLHTDGMKFVPIIDPGIMVYENYPAYTNGLKEGIFVKDITGSGYYLGQVWPGPTYFPDFLHPNIENYWTSELGNWYKEIPVDGLWIDMNEVSNFCNSDGTGQVCVNTASNGCPAPGASQTDCCLVCSTVDATNSLDFPPYNINNVGGRLSVKTMAMSGSHYGNVTVYDAHNLYGLTEQITTAAALRTIRQQRPFILSRSSFLSTGVHSAKWTGDNAATWDDLKSSIISLMDFSLFGIPMVGSDICGFLGDTTEELCTRWIEVGAFYPFSRNHNAIGQKNQELYLWDTVTTASKTYLGLRYEILPYMYTLFHDAHTTASLVTRALWANFPNDSTALAVERQFMLGGAVMISPVLDAGVTQVNAYFPAGLWYNLETRGFAYDTTSGGAYKTIDTPLTSTNVHVVGGNILPMQQAAVTTTIGRTTPFTLLNALNSAGEATGHLFWDNGEQIELTNSLQTTYTIQASGSSGSLSCEVMVSNYDEANTLIIDTIEVLGGPTQLSAPSTVTLNGVVVDTATVTFNAEKASITISSLAIKLTDAFTLSWN